MKPILRIQLSLMMFMQFFVWGAWYGQMSKYMTDQLHATGDQVGGAYAAFSIAMIVAPFFVGMLADRFFQAQKVLGVLNILGALILYVLTTITDADTFYWVMLLYCPYCLHFHAQHGKPRKGISCHQGIRYHRLDRCCQPGRFHGCG
jgi:MFS family permease